MHTILPWCAAGALIVWMASAAAGAGRIRGGWLLPAALSAVFCGWSLWAVIDGGALGFWAEHTRNAWGVQIWFDLLLAVGIGWTLVLPRLRQVGMRPWPWLVLVLGTGCIGFCALMARLVWLEERSPGSPRV